MRKKVAIVGGIALLVGLGILWVFGAGTPDSFDLPTPFSSSRWKATDGWHSARCSMVTDLTHRVGLVGKSKEEVISLLGKPDEQQQGFPTVYELCPSLADIYILELAWKQGHVASVRVHDT